MMRRSQEEESGRLRDIEHAVSKPSVLMEFLEEISPREIADAIQRSAPDESQAESVIRKVCRKEWYVGRSHRLLVAMKKSLQSKKATDRMVADTLGISAQAIGAWFNGMKGIEPENLEILIRFTCDVTGTEIRVAEHDRDLWGYRRAMGHLAKALLGSEKGLECTEGTFWRLWFLFRNRAWLEGTARKSDRALALAAMEIERYARKALHYEEDVALPSGGELVAQFQKMLDTWGRSFVCVIHLLDHYCWTAPHA
jgi:hypothetical protein